MAFDAATHQVDPLSLTTPRERLEYLRDFLRELPAERFDMGDWYTVNGVGRSLSALRKTAGDIVHDCGTAACIAGWAAAIFAPDTRSYAVFAAERALGLDDVTAAALFVPDGFARAGYTPYEASRVLDHLLATGEVDWSVARTGI